MLVSTTYSVVDAFVKFQFLLIVHFIKCQVSYLTTWLECSSAVYVCVYTENKCNMYYEWEKRQRRWTLYTILFIMASLVIVCMVFCHFCTARTRLAAAPQTRVLDNATRRRRQQRQLEALEKDNFHDDPHAIYAHLTSKTKLPTFADNSESACML